MVVLIVGGASLGMAQAPSLESVKTVYFWPMRHSLDQYLAEQLSTGGMFQVVVDPKIADAIITERIDAPFLKAMDEMFPTPGSDTSKSQESTTGSETSTGSVETGLQPSRPANRPLGQPAGTVFLVHAASRKVLWSTFIDQKDVLPKNLHRQARDIVGRLKREAFPRE